MKLDGNIKFLSLMNHLQIKYLDYVVNLIY